MKIGCARLPEEADGFGGFSHRPRACPPASLQWTPTSEISMTGLRSRARPDGVAPAFFAYARMPPFCETQWGHVGFRETATPCPLRIPKNPETCAGFIHSTPRTLPVHAFQFRSVPASGEAGTSSFGGSPFQSSVLSRRRRVLDSARRPDVRRRHGAWLLLFRRRPGQPLPTTWATSVSLVHGAGFSLPCRSWGLPAGGRPAMFSPVVCRSAPRVHRRPDCRTAAALRLHAAL